MKPEAKYLVGNAAMIFFRDGGHVCGIVSQCQYNGAHGAYRYKVNCDEFERGYVYVWEYELSALFATGWPNLVEATIDELVIL